MHRAARRALHAGRYRRARPACRALVWPRGQYGDAARRRNCRQDRGYRQPRSNIIAPTRLEPGVQHADRLTQPYCRRNRLPGDRGFSQRRHGNRWPGRAAGARLPRRRIQPSRPIPSSPEYWWYCQRHVAAAEGWGCQSARARFRYRTGQRTNGRLDCPASQSNL